MARYVNFDQMVDKINHELERSLSSVYFCEDGTKISADVGYVAEWFEDYVIKLHQIPLVDAVEVVRCKDCIYLKEAKVNSKGFLICPASGMEITEMDFCSYGERG